MMRRPGILLSVLFTCGAIQAQEPAARDSACQQAIDQFLAAARTPETERRLRLACYPGPGRAPVLREPLSVGNVAGKPPPPAVPAPVAPTLRVPSTPNVVTQCDAAGCWDNLGNRYSGTGNILHGPAGQPCVRSGDRIECR